MEFLEGKRKSSPGLILGMLRRLPEGSLFTAKLAAMDELERKQRKAAGEPDPEPDEDNKPSDLEMLIQEKLSWTGLNELVALLINRTSDGIVSQFPVDKRPKWDAVGPSWWPGTAKNKQKKNEVEAAEEPLPEGGVQPSLLTRFFAGKTGVNG